LEEVVDNTATFGDGLNDHSEGGEGDEGSGVNPAGAGGQPPIPRLKLLIWKCAYTCHRHLKHLPFYWCVRVCVYCHANPSKCSKKTLADEEQEGMPFVEKESAEA